LRFRVFPSTIFPFSNTLCPREFIDFSTDPLGVIVVIVCILKLKDATNGKAKSQNGEKKDTGNG